MNKPINPDYAESKDDQVPIYISWHEWDRRVSPTDTPWSRRVLITRKCFNYIMDTNNDWYSKEMQWKIENILAWLTYLV
jgi:hypothetical protein